MHAHQFQQGPTAKLETFDSFNLGFKLVTKFHHQHDHAIEIEVAHCIAQYYDFTKFDDQHLQPYTQR